MKTGVLCQMSGITSAVLEQGRKSSREQFYTMLPNKEHGSQAEY